MKAYCYECDKNNDVTIKEEKIEMSIKQINFSFIGNVAYCNSCNNEVYIPELKDSNVSIGNELYREKLNIIKASEIKELLNKYNIGSKPLSKLLGWSETTILRYLKGLMPSKEYSERLRELFNPYNMLEIFNKNNDVLTDIAKKKLDESIKKAFCYTNSITNTIGECHITKTIKTSISIKKELYDKANKVANTLNISRSKLYSIALERFLREKKHEYLLREINENYRVGTTKEDEDKSEMIKEHKEKPIET